ncbi:unnamed protein product [Schistocephalus solidus]|uniref:AIP3 domain-containing protein n=1 Tax=Schistocephalus solidus TaxID=70667 RepID=A0A183SII5_SCHSO|nr:unnamed protein product [Schistocephalus solidus]
MLPTNISFNNLRSGSSRQTATTIACGPPTALLPATVQIGPNGEKHLVIQYSDGPVFAAAFPQQGHLHFLPVSKAILPTTDGDCGNLTGAFPVSAAENSGDSGISTTLTVGTQGNTEQPSSQWSRPRQLSKEKLVCTCPPELHQGENATSFYMFIRQSQLPDRPCELVHSTNTQRYPNLPSKDIIKETSEALKLPSQQSTIPAQDNFPDASSLTTAGRWSTDNFQESDSTDTTSGSGQVAFPIIRGGIPPDVLLTPGAADKFRLATKPPQTLEEAQTRITLMEDQMAFLTSWVRAVQEQQGGQIKRTAGPEDSPINRTSLLSKSSSGYPCSYKEDFCPIGPSIPDNAQSPKIANSSDSFCQNVDTTKYVRLPSPKTSNWILQCGRSELQTQAQMEVLQVPPSIRCGLDNLKRTQLLHVSKRLREVKNDLGNLRRTQESNIGDLRQISSDLFGEIRRLLEKSSPKKMSTLRAARLDLDSQISTYLTDCNEVEDWLRDLEACIEELRIDALQRRCRVSVSEVETYALHLSRLSGRLVAFKEELPELKRATTTALLAEKKVVQLHERLGSVQEHGLSVNVPPLRTIRDPQPEDKQLYLQQIRNIIPDHEARVLGLACHKRARLRRKRMLSLKDSLKFEQSVGESRRNLDSILTRLGQVLLQQQALIPSSYPWSGYCTEERVENDEVSPHRRVRSVAAQTFNEQLLREESADGQPPTKHHEASSDHRNCEQGPDSICCDYCESQPHGAELGAYRGLAHQPLRSNREAKRRGASEEPQADYSQSRQNPPFSAQEVLSPQVKPSAVTSGGVSGTRRARVVFSRTVLVGDGRETTRLNCPSDLDEDDHTETSELDEQSGYHPWRKEQVHRGNKVVDIHPGLPRNQFITCGGQCGIQGGCTQTCCLARPRQSASVLKSSLVSSSSAEKSAPPAPPPRMSSSSSSVSASENQKDLLVCMSGSDAHHDHILPAETGICGPITEEDSDAMPAAEGNGHHHHHHQHHHYCRLSSGDDVQRKG